jgi:hypothetical protein
MTPKEHAKTMMTQFLTAEFDRIACGAIERAAARAIGRAVAEEREACAAFVFNLPVDRMCAADVATAIRGRK